MTEPSATDIRTAGLALVATHGNWQQIGPVRGQVAKLGDDTVIVPNAAALVGGARAWQLHVEF